jgi:hypothetical protein
VIRKSLLRHLEKVKGSQKNINDLIKLITGKQPIHGNKKELIIELTKSLIA